MRLNVSGPYAVARFTGAQMEGASWNADILLQKFSFGWQAVDTVNAPCSLTKRGIPKSVTRILLRKLHPLYRAWDASCGDVHGDLGPQQDVETIRSIMHFGVFVPWVRVVGHYAMVTWMFPGGGTTIFRKKNDKWKALLGGGGIPNVQGLVEYGVPRSTACRLFPKEDLTRRDRC